MFDDFMQKFSFIRARNLSTIKQMTNQNKKRKLKPESSYKSNSKLRYYNLNDRNIKISLKLRNRLCI